jgi:predicted heme/steroid binding protein
VGILSKVCGGGRERDWAVALRLIGGALFLFAFAFTLPVFATEEYARQAGKACGVCHVNPGGGGELTAGGRAFKGTLGGSSASVTGSAALRLTRLPVGYVHLLTAILWFGTILYVHLVLRPAYAARGLPRGEVRVGLVSMLVMAVTGTILALFRVPSLDVLFHTRFGILLMVKVALFLCMVASALVAVLVVGPRLRRQAGKAGVAGKQDLTLEELTQFDGKEGRPSYIGYKGGIYDVALGRWWIEGTHAGRHHAGADLTDMLEQAPHGEENVLRMPLVGRLLPTTQARARSPQEKAFYVMAYVNLSMALLIVFIVALWRWW